MAKKRFPRHVGFIPDGNRRGAVGDGMALHGKYALVGLSKTRNRSFSGLALDEKLKKRNAEARCGVVIIDLDTGNPLHHLRIEGMIEELFDVSVIPGAGGQKALGLSSCVCGGRVTT